MKKKLFNFKRFTALRLIVAILLLSAGPTAEAGVLDWLAGNPNAPVPGGYAPAYLSSAGFSNNQTVQPTAAANQFTTIQNSYLMPTGSPVKINNVPLIVKSEAVVSATGYSSTPDQTDSSPFITAMGTTVRDGIIAANFLPFGTKVKIPSHFGDKIFTVEDRMNPRYDQRIDLWFPDRDSAKQFGLRTVKIQILGI